MIRVALCHDVRESTEQSPKSGKSLLVGPVEEEKQLWVAIQLDFQLNLVSKMLLKRAKKLPHHTSSSVFSVQSAQKLLNLTSPSDFSQRRAKKLPNLTSSSSNLPRLTVISCSTSLVGKV